MSMNGDVTNEILTKVPKGYVDLEVMKPETITELKTLLDKMERPYYDALAVPSGSMISYIVTEPEALQTIQNIKTHLEKIGNKKHFCCRCKEDFPVKMNDSTHGTWSMGELRLLKYAPRKIKEEFRDWLKSDLHGDGYLCGNCYMDLTE